MTTPELMEQLQQKIAKLDDLRNSKEANKERTKQLQQEIDDLVNNHPELPHKSDQVWFWYTGYSGKSLLKGTVQEIAWRTPLQCFKIHVVCGDTSVWRTPDLVWKTEKEAKRWELERLIKVARYKLEVAQKNLDDLIKQLEEF